jgi:malate dehydrogenase (oxaloacetate-decarboxylating)(NADP+)
MTQQDDDGTIDSSDALEYHEKPRPGKFEIKPTKPLSTQRDLSLAYTPGVAEPCREIADDPLEAYRYTNRRNQVCVLSDGSATLGLGDVGPLACKPVMEGKAVLFKHLAGVDALDVELDIDSVEEFITCAKALEPTYGAINLEDIASPACFEIEERLKDEVDIPVFHDDQHGTAIITGAALLNALELQDKDIEDIEVVFAGAGAAAVATAHLYEALGVRRDNIKMADSIGVVYEGRDEAMDEYKGRYAHPTEERTLDDALRGADVLVGVAVGGIVSQEMVASMADNPVIFALANPDPEISYPDAMEVRDDLIMATGRSDYPNQVNNVLGFPFIFRGAIDVAATAINQEMMVAAVEALADLAQEEVPEVVSRAYGEDYFVFGPNYIIPKPFDPRALLRVAPAVAEAACESGVAQQPIDSVRSYRQTLERLQSESKALIRRLIDKAKRDPKRIVFPEGNEDKILRASQILADEQIAEPVLLGPTDEIRERADKLDIDLEGIELIDHFADARFDEMAEKYYQLRQRKGVTLADAKSAMKHRELFGLMLVREGQADGFLSGVTRPYQEMLRPALEIIGVQEEFDRAAGTYIVMSEDGAKFFADATVNISPDAETLADIAINTADLAQAFDITPRISMLSYSNFGSSEHRYAEQMARATEMVKQRQPDLEVDGEMQVDVALDSELRESTFEFAELSDDANVFIFPNLDAGNIAYQMMQHLAGAEVIGPILLGMDKPVNVISLGSSVSSIVNLTVITALKAQLDERRR